VFGKLLCVPSVYSTEGDVGAGSKVLVPSLLTPLSDRSLLTRSHLILYPFPRSYEFTNTLKRISVDCCSSPWTEFDGL